MRSLVGLHTNHILEKSFKTRKEILAFISRIRNVNLQFSMCRKKLNTMTQFYITNSISTALICLETDLEHLDLELSILSEKTIN